MEITVDIYDAIMEDAYRRHREYERSVAGRAQNQTMNEKDNFEWWLLTSAYKAGLEASNTNQ